MDYRDYQEGMPQKHFWLRAKLDFINVLLNKVNFDKTTKILDIGVGIGQDLEVINKFGCVYAIDIDKKTLDLVPEHMVFEKILADATNIPYPDNFFDMVVSFDVFEHIKDDSKTLSEIYRVLKKDGVLIFTVPAFNFLFSNHDSYLGHYRRYNKKMIKKLLVNFNCLTNGYWMSTLFLSAAICKNYKKYSFNIPKFINSLCYNILSFENWLIKRSIKLPIGLSIYGIYRVKKT